MATKKLTDSFAEVAFHLLMNRSKFDFSQLLGKDSFCKQFFKMIDRGLTIEQPHIFNDLAAFVIFPTSIMVLFEIHQISEVTF